VRQTYHVSGSASSPW